MGPVTSRQDAFGAVKTCARGARPPVNASLRTAPGRAQDEGAEELAMIALSTISILSIVMCFNAVLFLSLGLYLYRHRRADPVLR
jgi:hypothetical protein